MRRPGARKSRRRSAAEGPVSLFPFLAVLICTMGSLILLLVVIARQARLHATETDAPADEELRAEIDQELEMARFMASQYDDSREATKTDLEEARYKLGQIEDHTGQLRRQLADLQDAWKQLDQLESGEQSARQAGETELETLAAEIHRLEKEVEQARQESGNRQPAYSIVPYDGPHGTKRRPIYLECRADGLVLQPEGIRFLADDFEGPLDAGNPLDVGLRAVREYLAAQESVLRAEGAEPYPLLLVRPSGIGFFYAARSAMKSWGTEFGYELIGDDWELDFPKPDPVLRQTVAHAVEPARLRQQRLIAAAPSRYGRGGDRPVYTVQPYHGGVTSRGGSGGGSDNESTFGLKPSDAHGRIGTQQAGGSPAVASSGHPGGQTPSQPGGTAGAGDSPESGSGEKCETPVAPGQGKEAPQSLAKTRGRNWGLPDANQSAVAITRPIRVECHPDRLVLVPERGLGDPKVIALAGGVEASIDAFVSSVWDYMETWGKAGRGMYWRPVLNVYVKQDAELTLVELEVLLDDSGLLLNRAEPAAPRQTQRNGGMMK